MRRPKSFNMLNGFLLLILSLMVLAISTPGCEPAGYDSKPPVKENDADIEIKHPGGRSKIEIDRKNDGSIKIDIERKKDEEGQKSQTEPRQRAVPFSSSSVA